jgi:phosphoserine phosphatase RsbU/P
MKITNNLKIKKFFKQLDTITYEANRIRDNDKILLEHLFSDFYDKKLNIGVGFKRAYGSVLSGDYFDLIKLPDNNYLFVFADISGHGLPAYTTTIRLRSAITIAINETKDSYAGMINTDSLIKDINTKFTDIMDSSESSDFACVNFTFIYSEEDRFHLKFYNRSMLFPIVVRKFQNKLMDIFNLNEKDKGWIPKKGYLMGSDLRKILGSAYNETPSCEFVLYEGDSILFYSDGITEAFSNDRKRSEFGEKRLEKILKDTIDLPPQESVDIIYDSVYKYIGKPENQKDDMTAVLINFPRIL